MRTNRLARWLRSLATYDFAPHLSAKVRGLLYNPFGILLGAAIVALLCGLFLHAQGFVLCGGILAVMTLGVVWPWMSLRGLGGTIHFNRTRTSEGEPVEVHLTLRNRLPWPVWGLAIRDGFGGPSSEPVAGIASVPGRRTALCHWSFTPLCRGLYPLSVPKITTGFPFGLWDTQRELEVEAPLVVWPRTYPVGPIPPVSGEHQVEGNVSRNKVGTNGDVLGVRPYRRGDVPRRIHWGQSARHDRLIVCELQSNSRPMIQVVLDADPRVHVGSGTDSSREWAIRIVASFAKGWLEEGALVGLAFGNHDIPPASGQAQLHRILDTLARLPAECEWSLAEVLACPRCRGFRDGLQVIVTTDLTHAHGNCGTCQLEDQRWVILKTSAFTTTVENATCGHCPNPWLLIDAIEAIPSLLKGGWREARHGS